MLKTKINKVIYIDTVTREFIKFAKMMGIFPKICYQFRKLLSWDAYQYYGGNRNKLFHQRLIL